RTGSIAHMGNVDPAELFGPSRPPNTYNWNSLDGHFQSAGYLSPYSDVTALMVFDHQMRMMNLFSRMGWEARAPADVALAAAAIEVVDYMLFVDEAPLPNAVESSNGFPAT